MPREETHAQTYGVDWFETFSPGTRLNFIRVIFYAVVNQRWPMVQLDVKNVFLYLIFLWEEVYMKQTPRYVA